MRQPMREFAVKMDTAGKTFTIDGQDVASQVTSAHVDITGRQIPTVTLALLLTRYAGDLDRARVLLDEKTAALLELLGWTPPTDGG